MSSHTAWAQWIHDNTVVIMLLISLGFGLIIWMGNKIFTMYRVMATMEKREEDSNINRLVNSIEKLVKRIDELFVKHDGHEARIGKIEKRIGEHFTRCNEREKLLNDIKGRQDKGLDKLNNLAAGGSRKADPPPDRSERTD